ncbi:MAG TPA: alpha/beta hydrolase [Patescibacteria group bacterium]|nr:alpha/beta hydrolase [Patescibacteria group bacterium]
MKSTALSEPKRFAVGASQNCRTVVVDGVSIAYDDRGAGFPVVGLHAITHGSRDFEHVANGLAARWRFITPDWPGQGRSGPDAEPARLDRYTALLAGFLDALKIDRAILIGNSIGGSAAMAYAAKFPDRVAGLVLADPGGLIPMNAFGYRFCGLMAALGRAGHRNAFYFSPIFSILYRQFLRTPAARAQRGRIVEAAPECAGIWEQAWLSFRTPDADQTNVGAHITCPVLFTWAERDPVVSYAASKSAIARFPNHSVALFEGGHCPFLEEPEKFLAAVQPFLERTTDQVSGRQLSAKAV